jgi:glycosyltransferase involved in cell wall biosynthesis
LNKHPLVSVVIPAYNCEQYIKATVQSILDQTYGNLEVIIVDDGSSDSTGEVCKSLVSQYSNIIYTKEENGGVSRARNIGLSKCEGEYICFLDGDDLWPNNKIATQVCFLNKNLDYNFVCGRYKEVEHNFILDESNSPDTTLDLDSNNSGWIYCKQLRGMHIHIISLMFRRKYLDQVHFDTELTIAEDYDLWLRISANHKIAYLDACLAYYRRHRSSIMTKPQNKCYKAIVLERNVEKFGLKCKSGEELSKDEFDSYLYHAWFSHGYVLYHTGKMYKQCLHAQLNAIRFKKFAVTPWKYIAASYFMLILSKVRRP